MKEFLIAVLPFIGGWLVGWNSGQLMFYPVQNVKLTNKRMIFSVIGVLCIVLDGFLLGVFKF